MKIVIELCDGGTAEPVNAVKTVNSSISYADTLRTYCSERENSQMLSPNWQPNNYFTH